MYDNTIARPTRGRKPTVKDMIVDEAIGAAMRYGPSLAKGAYNQLAAAVTGLVSGSKSGKNGERMLVKDVAPLAQSIRSSGSRPKFTQSSGGICVTNTELVPNFASGTGDISLQINSTTFPWLSPLTTNFEEWRCKMQYGWIPTCPATTAGTVFLAWDYDPDDPSIYIDEDYFQTLDHSVGAAWAPGAISPRQSGWLKTNVTGLEPRTYSPGRLHFSNPAAASGYFMVRYTVELRKPQPNSVSSSVFGGVATTDSTTSDVFGSTGLVNGDLRVITFTGNNKIGFTRNKKYMVTVFFNFSANPGAINLNTSLDIGQTPVTPTSAAVFNSGGYKVGVSFITSGFGSLPTAVTTFAWSSAPTAGVSYSYLIDVVPLVSTNASP